MGCGFVIFSAPNEAVGFLLVQGGSGLVSAGCVVWRFYLECGILVISSPYFVSKYRRYVCFSIFLFSLTVEMYGR